MTECDPLKNPIYPINTLRRLAINNIRTSHFVNLDMDLWPSCPFSRQLSWLVRLYESLQRIDAATAHADRVVHAESARDLQDAARLLRSVKRGVTVVENGVVSVHAQTGLSDRQRVPADARKWREILLTRSASSTRRGGASNAPCKPFPAFRTRSWNRTW